MAQAVYKAPAQGVTAFDVIRRPRKEHKAHNGAQHVAKKPTLCDRRGLDKNQIGQDTDDPVHYMSGESPVMPIPRPGTAVVQSVAFLRVSDPKRTMGHVGGGGIK